MSKSDEQRERFWKIFRKTVLRIKDENGPIYFIRYSLFSCPWFAIKLHNILISDDDCLHDHPWSFLSIILRGGYVEHSMPYINKPEYILIPNLPFAVTKRLYGAGSILWRKAPSVHRLEVFQPTWTLVITFKKVRVWGFITARGWKPWYEYIRDGRKCE